MAVLIRLFVGAFPDPGDAERLHAALAEARAAARDWRWLPAERFHVTLRFIGEVDPARVDTIVSALGTVADLEAMRIEARRLIGLPSSRRARVLALAGGSAGVVENQARIAAALAADVGLESRRFLPHLSVARRPAPHRFARLDIAPREVALGGIGLYASEQRDGGAHYRALRQWPVPSPHAGERTT